MRRVLIGSLIVLLAVAVGSVAAQRRDGSAMAEVKAELLPPPRVPAPVTRRAPARGWGARRNRSQDTKKMKLRW